MLPSEPAGAHKTAVPARKRLLTDIKAKSQQVVKHGGQMWLCALGQRPPRSYWKNNSRPSKEVRDADQRRVTLGSFLLYCLVTHGFLSRPSGMTKASWTEDSRTGKSKRCGVEGGEAESVLQGPHVSHALDCMWKLHGWPQLSIFSYNTESCFNVASNLWKLYQRCSSQLHKVTHVKSYLLK